MIKKLKAAILKKLVKVEGPEGQEDIGLDELVDQLNSDQEVKKETPNGNSEETTGDNADEHHGTPNDSGDSVKND